MNRTFPCADWLIKRRISCAIHAPRSQIREKMASRFVSVLEEEILKINEEGTPLSTKKATKFGVSLFGSKFLVFLFLILYFILFYFIIFLFLMLS